MNRSTSTLVGNGKRTSTMFCARSVHALLSPSLGKPLTLYQPNYRGMPSDALAVFGPQLLEAAVKEANNPAHVPPGELRKIERLDETGRVRYIDWIGQDSFVKDMMRPGRRVVSFTTDRGKYNASKGSWF